MIGLHARTGQARPARRAPAVAAGESRPAPAATDLESSHVCSPVCGSTGLSWPLPRTCRMTSHVAAVGECKDRLAQGEVHRGKLATNRASELAGLPLAFGRALAESACRQSAWPCPGGLRPFAPALASALASFAAAWRPCRRLGSARLRLGWALTASGPWALPALTAWPASRVRRPGRCFRAGSSGTLGVDGVSASRARRRNLPGLASAAASSTARQGDARATAGSAARGLSDRRLLGAAPLGRGFEQQDRARDRGVERADRRRASGSGP